MPTTGLFLHYHNNGPVCKILAGGNMISRLGDIFHPEWINSLHSEYFPSSTKNHQPRTVPTAMCTAQSAASYQLGLTCYRLQDGDSISIGHFCQSCNLQSCKIQRQLQFNDWPPSVVSALIQPCLTTAL